MSDSLVYVVLAYESILSNRCAVCQSYVTSVWKMFT